MGFKSHIYNIDGIPNDTNWGFTILTVLTLALGYLLTDVYEPLGVIIIVIASIGVFYSIARGYGKKEEEGQYVGEIILNDEEFTLNNELIKTSEINELKIDISYTKGEKLWWTYGYTISSGTRSSIELTARGKKLIYNFQLFSDRHLSELKTTLEGLYSQKISIKEYHLGQRTYLLENLDYEDIQEFKKKYKLS